MTACHMRIRLTPLTEVLKTVLGAPACLSLQSPPGAALVTAAAAKC